MQWTQFLFCLLTCAHVLAAEEQKVPFPTSESLPLIGGLISPLSGNFCVKKIDLIAKGAQEIPLSRVYIAPHMPYSFQKQWDSDCYSRRMYLIQNYKGWKFFPHRYLWIDPINQVIHLTNANGSSYDFSAGSNSTLLNTYGFNNLGCDERPSGCNDPKNTRITYNETHATVIAPDGSTRYYKKESSGLGYLLEKEILPNGKILKYYHTDGGNLSLVESLDPQERHVYASIQVHGIPEEGCYRFTSSNGLEAAFTFESQPYKGKFCKGKEKRSYTGATPHLMVAAHSPHSRTEKITYSDPSCLLHSFSGKNESFILSQTGFGEGKSAHFRVDQLLLPTGMNNAFAPLFQMHYRPAVAGEKEGMTTVKNSDGTSTIYHFSKNLLLTLIQDFREDGILQKEKIYSWNENNWLNNIELKDGHGNLFIRKSYTYDAFGNPIQEIVTGDLQGTGNEVSDCIERTYSQEGRNLLLGEETEEGKITLFTYLPGTNLITLKLIMEGPHILLKESYEYDEFHNLMRKTCGDGDNQCMITSYALRQEQPFLHLPEWIEERYLDHGEEKLLKRIHLSYDRYGNVSEEKIYDAEGHHAYTLFKEYNERGELLSETNPLGQKRTFVYDSQGNCIEAIPFSQKLKEEMRYDRKGRLQSHRLVGDDGVHTAHYSYNAQDNLIQKMDTYHNILTYEYDPLTLKVIRTDFPPLLTREGEAFPFSTFSTYDALGRETSKTDGRGETTWTTYNAYGLPTQITYPNGSQECYSYTKSGKVAFHIDREGLITTYSYDVLGRIISKSYGDLGQEKYVYDSLHLLQAYDLNGTCTHFVYDGAGRKIREEVCGRVTGFTYDSLGRLESESQDALITLFKRDLEGRILKVSKASRAGALLQEIDYKYDEEGNLSESIRFINNQKAIASYAYDCFGREIEHTDPLGHKTVTAYNENYLNSLGQKVLQITTVDPQRIKSIEIKDPFHRTVQKETLSPKGRTLAHWEKFYDPNGNLLDWKEDIYEKGTCHSTHWTCFTYTSNNQIASITRACDTLNARTVRYTYTLGGKVLTKRLPGGITLFYTYSPLGFLNHLRSSDKKISHHFEYNTKGDILRAYDEVENVTIQRELDPFGNVTREVFPHPIEIKKEYDLSNRLVALHLSNIRFYLLQLRSFVFEKRHTSLFRGEKALHAPV